MTTQKNPWTVLSRKQVYESPWIGVSHHDVIHPSGNPGTYSVVHFKKLAIGVIPLDEDNNTWIVGQYRYPLETYTWEIPEGGGERDVAPEDSARRELEEECGIVAKDLMHIQSLQLSNSATDEEGHVFVARGLSFTQSNPDETEQLHVRKVHFDELYRMVTSGEITDSLTVAGVLRLKLMMVDGTLQPL